tara:strand:+ start:484 stop:600 length:117 start_codon:yes stop_codon:yes gene_type:complete
MPFEAQAHFFFFFITALPLAIMVALDVGEHICRTSETS